MKGIIVASTGGAVVNELLKYPLFASFVHSIVSDRNCGALDVAKRHSVPYALLGEKDPMAFSEQVESYAIEHHIDYIISFYTKLFRGSLLNTYRDRLINNHPSLLPAFKGLNSFSDALRQHAKFIGCTVHFIDENMDEGKYIIQSVQPCNPYEDIALTRHKLFVQQCKALLQVVKWLVDERIEIQSNIVVVNGASYQSMEFSPNLDYAESVGLTIPMPGS